MRCLAVALDAVLRGRVEGIGLKSLGGCWLGLSGKRLKPAVCISLRESSGCTFKNYENYEFLLLDFVKYFFWSIKKSLILTPRNILST